LRVVFSHKSLVISFFRMIALVLGGMGVAPKGRIGTSCRREVPTSPKEQKSAQVVEKKGRAAEC
jgi:hypothetical protein